MVDSRRPYPNQRLTGVAANIVVDIRSHRMRKRNDKVAEPDQSHGGGHVGSAIVVTVLLERRCKGRIHTIQRKVLEPPSERSEMRSRAYIGGQQVDTVFKPEGVRVQIGSCARRGQGSDQNLLLQLRLIGWPPFQRGLQDGLDQHPRAGFNPFVQERRQSSAVECDPALTVQFCQWRPFHEEWPQVGETLMRYALLNGTSRFEIHRISEQAVEDGGEDQIFHEFVTERLKVCPRQLVHQSRVEPDRGIQQ